jgi:hypothetical protein
VEGPPAGCRPEGMAYCSGCGGSAWPAVKSVALPRPARSRTNTTQHTDSHQLQTAINRTT